MPGGNTGKVRLCFPSESERGAFCQSKGCVRTVTEKVYKLLDHWFVLMKSTSDAQRLGGKTNKTYPHMKNSTKPIVTAVAVLAMSGLAAFSARADQQITERFNQPIQVTANIDETGCDNSPGPQITVQGEIVLGGLQMKLILANNVKGTHTTVVTLETNVVLVPLGGKIVIPKQPVLGGVGGNPYIWLQFYDKSGNLTDPVFLGRCVQGLQVPGDFLNSSLAELLVNVLGCENNPGPYIYIGGDLKLSGLHARLIFTNNTKGTHKTDAQVWVDVIPEGTVLTIPKQPVLGGSGGNPLIWVQLLQGDGTPISDPQFLGRCNKL